MFDKFRQQLNEILDRATPPEDRRAMMSRMKDTLVQARIGLDDLRSGLSATRVKLKLEERELETIQRRKKLASDINDAETVGVAGKFEAHQSERVAVLRRKLEAQEAEIALAEREVTSMTEDLRAAAAGIGPGAAGARPRATGEGEPGPAEPDAHAAAADAAADGGATQLREELDSLARTQARASRDAAAEDKLAELKRRMGK
jgi:hypothetical protein